MASRQDPMTMPRKMPTAMPIAPLTGRYEVLTGIDAGQCRPFIERMYKSIAALKLDEMPENSHPTKLRLQHTPVEIERKFLVLNDEWRRSAVRSVSIRDGLIAAYEGSKVRVRISGNVATLAIKGSRTGISRPEFEYEIPIADAEQMLSTMCRDTILEKERFFVEDAGAMWHVDVYGGILRGEVIAEIELKQETQALKLPQWIGKEVTGNVFYKKTNMRTRHTRSAR
jgi:CYTH domain-containing protein